MRRGSSFLYICLLLLLIVLVSCEDFYQILEITRDSTKKEMKKKYRELSKKFHPDKNPNAKEKYLRIQKAYETLSNPETKRIYDIYGEEGLSQENLMHEQHNRRKGPNASVEVSVTLEDLYNGDKKDLTLTKNVVCKKCHGTGGKLGKTKACNQCQGRGVVMQDVDTGMGFSLRMQNPCPKCKGKGIMFSEVCDECRGKKVLREEKTLKVVIEKGMRDGEQILFRGESEQSPDTVPGDLIVHLKQRPHDFFHTRRQHDLYADFQINLKEALLGYKKKITHLDKREFFVESNKPTQPFSVRLLPNEGMPVHSYPSSKGNLFVKFNIKLPSKLKDEERLLIQELFQ